MRRRVAITGMGVVSPVGNTVGEFLDNLLAGRSGVGPITLFDPASLRTRIAAEVKWVGPILRDRKITFAVEVARQAFLDATSCGSEPRGERGVSLGIGLELFSMEDMVLFRRPGFALPATLAGRLTFLQTPSDLCVHLIAKRYEVQTPPVTHVSACAAGTDAIGTAFRMIRAGRRDWMFAGGHGFDGQPPRSRGILQNRRDVLRQRPTRTSLTAVRPVAKRLRPWRGCRDVRA